MRKTKIVTITAEGRDKGKSFLIKEMPARRGEDWAARALLAVADAGINIGDIDPASGLAGLAVAGLRALKSVSFDTLEPLMNEMMLCVRIMPDPAHPELIRDLIDRGQDDDDIEEVATRVELRREVFEIHTGFSLPGVRST